MAMTVTYVDRQKNRKTLSPELTSYVLPDSGKLMIREIASSHLQIGNDIANEDTAFPEVHHPSGRRRRPQGE